MKIKRFLFQDTFDSTATRFPELDVLRFLAALLVLVYHFTASGIGNTMHEDRYNLIATADLFPWLTPFTKFGFLGVHLFFLISGFIIFVSAQNRQAIDFAVNRAIRLYPTYWLSIAFTVVVLLFFLGYDYSLQLSEIALNLTMIQSYLGAGHLDPVYWTLVVELHFYFIVFLLIAFNQLSAWRFWITLWIVLNTISTFAFDIPYLNYLLETQFAGYFIAGMVFSSVYRRGWDIWSLIVICLTFLLCVEHLPEQIKLYNFGVSDTQDAVIGSLIIASFYLAFWAIVNQQWSLENRTLYARLGLLTYPLYLTHHQFGRYFIDATYQNLGGFMSVILATVLSLFFALTFVLIIDDRINPMIKQAYQRIKLSIHRKGQLS